jgi:hypothetical protein
MCACTDWGANRASKPCRGQVSRVVRPAPTGGRVGAEPGEPSGYCSKPTKEPDSTDARPSLSRVLDLPPDVDSPKTTARLQGKGGIPNSHRLMPYAGRSASNKAGWCPSQLELVNAVLTRITPRGGKVAGRDDSRHGSRHPAAARLRKQVPGRASPPGRSAKRCPASALRAVAAAPPE